MAALKAGDSDKDNMIAFLEEKAESASRYYREMNEARSRFATEMKTLEDALRDATQPDEDEAKDTVVLGRSALVYKLEELERNLVGAARHGMQLKVANPGMQFYMDGLHFLK